jgi:hypothetical protein
MTDEVAVARGLLMQPYGDRDEPRPPVHGR